MKALTRWSIAAGTLLLVVGVGFYVRLALTGEGALLWVFLCCMASLFFFNLPSVVRRARDGRMGESDEKTTVSSGEEEP